MVPAPQDEFALTEAKDWKMLAAIGTILLAMISGMWIDLKSTIKDNRIELRQEIAEHKSDTKREQEKLWSAIEDCRGEIRKR